MNRFITLSGLVSIGLVSSAYAERYHVIKISDLNKVTHYTVATTDEVEEFNKEFDAEDRLFSRVYRDAKTTWEKERPDTPFPRFPRRKYSTSATYQTLAEAEDRLKHQRLKNSIDSRKRDQIRARLPTKRDERAMLADAALGLMEKLLTGAMKDAGFERSVFTSPRGAQGRGKPMAGHMEFDVAGTLKKASSGEYFLLPSNEEQQYELPPWEMDISRADAEALGMQTKTDRSVVITFSAELHGHSGGVIRFLEIKPIACTLDN